MMTTLVRSLWGQGTLQFLKVLWDVKRAPDVGGLVYAMSDEAEQFLQAVGIPCKAMRPERPTIYGSATSSHWWLKLAAVRQGIIDSGGPVVHLDWDTIPCSPLPSLDAGPAFQGRLRHYKRTQIRNRRPPATVYHGGCFYVRDLPTIDRLIAIHASEFPTHTDEVAMTRLADLLTGKTNCLAHRAAGVDNPRLYSTRADAIQSNGVLHSFQEGPIVRPSKFAKVAAALIAAAQPRTNRIRIPRGVRSEASLQTYLASLRATQ